MLGEDETLNFGSTVLVTSDSLLCATTVMQATQELGMDSDRVLYLMHDLDG